MDSSVDDSEADRLRAEVDLLLNNDVAAWLKVVRAKSAVASDYENSLSWRITRPLRLARSFQVKVREDGVRSAVGQAATRVRQKLSS